MTDALQRAEARYPSAFQSSSYRRWDFRLIRAPQWRHVPA
jgi:hypothetical protein